MTKKNKRNVQGVALVPVLCKHSEPEIRSKSQEQHKAWYDLRDGKGHVLNAHLDPESSLNPRKCLSKEII